MTGRNEREPDWPEAMADAFAASLIKDRAMLRRALAGLGPHELARLADAASLLSYEARRAPRPPTGSTT